jgi:hypothetical protein
MKLHHLNVTIMELRETQGAEKLWQSHKAAALQAGWCLVSV